jgi:hypothetical protein
LLRSFELQLVDLQLYQPEFVTRISARPVGSPVARALALSEELVTNMRHLSVKLNDFERLVLTLLDGTSDRAAVLDSLTEAAAEGDLEIRAPDGTAPKDCDLRAVLEQTLEPCLQRLARSALLVG